MALNPPSDLKLHPIWNHAVYWVALETDNFQDNALVDPVFAKFQQKIVAASPLPYAFPEVPGLIIRRAVVADIPAIADMLIKSGNVQEERAVALLEQLVNDPFAWAMIWELDGTPIQFETIMLGPDDAAYIGYLVHFARTYAQWVWGAMEAPVRDWLTTSGYKTLRSLMRKDRAAYRLERTKKVYNLRQTGETENFIRLEWELESKALPKFPARKTAGIGWEFSYKNVWFREMQDSDLADVKAAIIDEFERAGLRRGDDAAHLLEERWRVEKAAVLLGYVNGKIRFVRTAREREPGQAAVSTLNPLLVNNESCIVSYVAVMWLRLLGYTSAVMFIPEKQLRTEKMRRYLNEVTQYMKEFSVHPHFDGPVHEYGLNNFDPILKVKLENWA